MSHRLDAPALAAIDCIVSYMVGGTRVPLRVGGSPDQAATFLKEFRRVAERSR
jgi:hypothetical protein